MAGDRSLIKDKTTSEHSFPSNNNKINTNGHAPPSKDKLKMSVKTGGHAPSSKDKMLKEDPHHLGEQARDMLGVSVYQKAVV